MENWYNSEYVKPWEYFSEDTLTQETETRKYTPYFIGYSNEPIINGACNFQILRCVCVEYHYYIDEENSDKFNVENRWLWDCGKVPDYWRPMIETPNDNNILNKIENE